MSKDRPSDEAIGAALDRLNAPPPESEPPPEAEVRHLQPVPDEKPPIILVNRETGEHVGDLATVEAAHEEEIAALQSRYRAAVGQITKLTKDSEAEARKHELWDQAEGLHTWWRIATGRCGRKFGADEFYQALPRLKDRECGVIGVLEAIAGAAFDPGTKQLKNGETERYDDWELVTRSPGKLESFRKRAPRQRDDPHYWRRWLLAHIEAQLEERPRDKKATEAFHAADGNS